MGPGPASGWAIIGRGEAGGRQTPAGAGIGEKRDRVGSLGAIWWIRRLSWDGGQEHNAVRCPEMRDNIIREYLVMNKTSYNMILCFGLESKYNDRP